MFWISNLCNRSVVFWGLLLNWCRTSDFLVGIPDVLGRVRCQTLLFFVVHASENVANQLALLKSGHTDLVSDYLSSLSCNWIETFLKRLVQFRTSRNGWQVLFLSKIEHTYRVNLLNRVSNFNGFLMRLLVSDLFRVKRYFILSIQNLLFFLDFIVYLLCYKVSVCLITWCRFHYDCHIQSLHTLILFICPFLLLEDY